MNNSEIKEIVFAINKRQIELQSVDNDAIRQLALSCNLIDVYASVKEFARRLSLGDVVVSPTPLDLCLAADESFDFITELDNKVVYHHSWLVYNETVEWKMVHYDEQLEGGILLHEGCAIEMATGEGKTLVATLPVVLNALSGNSVHLMTVNSYLSRRDFELTRPIYAFFGLSSGCIDLFPYSSKERINAYKSNVVFGTNSEFVWDYLRDHLLMDSKQIHQHNHDFAIIDEIDSILVDNAVIPHIISGHEHFFQNEQYSLWKSAIEDLIKDNSLYVVDKARAVVKLTEEGEKWLSLRSEWSKVKEMDSREGEAFINYWKNVQHQLLRAFTLFTRNVDYIVYEGRIVIIDPFTGRRSENCRWEYGLHTAVEVKEGVLVKSDSIPQAAISIKNYFRLYNKCAGMSGTVLSVADEFRNSYGLSSHKINTHNPCLRVDNPLRVFKNEESKNYAIAHYVQSMHNLGHPILIGCRDMVRTELLANVLTKFGLEFELLDARDFGLEAYKVSQAGKYGKILLSTSMAGRGTDIKLDERAFEAGGLVVVGADLFCSERVEKQLRGRSGRQGDPGMSVVFTSVDDNLTEFLPPTESMRLKDIVANSFEDEITTSETQSIMRHAQALKESYMTSLRLEGMRKDDIINPHRKEYYALREDILCDNQDLEVFLHSFLKSTEELTVFEKVWSSLYEKANLLSNQSIFDVQREDKYYLPLACLQDTYTIELDWLKLDNQLYFRTQFIKQVILQVYDREWRNFVEYMMQQLTNDQIDSLEENLISRLSGMDDLIQKRLLYSSVPLNVNKKIDSSCKHCKREYPSISVTHLNIQTECPCGSGKLFSLCHGNRVLKKRR